MMSASRRSAQIQDNLNCLEWKLSPAHLAKLDEAIKRIFRLQELILPLGVHLVVT